MRRPVDLLDLSAAPNDAGRYVVTRPFRESGIGSNLKSMAGALWLASILGRGLIVDWREMVFLKDPALNYFTEFFQTPKEIAGVPLVYAGSGPTADYRRASPELVVELDPNEAARRRDQLADASSYLVLTNFHPLERLDPHGDRKQQFGFLKHFYQHVVLKDRLQRKLDEWHAQHMDGFFVVGVNVSTGNGLFLPESKYPGRTNVRLFEREKTFLRKVQRACDRAARDLPEFFRDDYRIFYATDSPKMHALLARLPRALSRRTVFPPAGAGRHFADYGELGYTDREAAEDVLIDMFLLARCNALVRNFSHFSVYAMVMNDFFAGNVCNFESLYVGTRMRSFRSRAKLRTRLRHLIRNGVSEAERD